METETLFRIAFGVVLLANLFISGSFRRKARATGDTIARRAESGRLIAMRLLVTVPLLLAFVLYLAYPAALDWSRLVMAEGLRWVGVGLGVLTIAGSWWVFTNIGRNISETVLTKSDHALITSGPYRWVRHPLYTNGLLLLMALGVIAANWFILGMAVLCTVAIAGLVVPKEEHELINRFGDAYQTYRSQTGGLIPRLFQRPASA